MALTYPGGYITKSPPTPTSTSAPGIWTMDQALQYIKAGTWPTPPVGDQYFQYTNLLLGTGSTNGAQNNTFLDSSSNNFTITRNGNTTQGSFSPFSQAAGYWSNYFDGTGDYLQIAANSAFNCTGDFTLEFWINPFNNSGSSGYQLYIGGAAGASYFGLKNNQYVAQFSGGGEMFWTGEPTLNVWTHLALVRSGSTVTLYVNGASVGTNTSSAAFLDATNALQIGAYAADFNTKGYLSNFRLVKGTAVYTANFTVPTTALTAITNTSLLTCQSNRFVDNSSNKFAITVNGNPAVISFQPFGAPTSPYSTTNVGGSGYFDGTGDYLSVADAAALDLGTGDFTIEGWVYMDSGVADNAGIVTKRPESTFNTGDWRISYRTATKKISFASNTTNERSTPVVNVNGWVHFAFVRSGTTISCYANGARGDSVTDAVNLDNGNPVEIGRNSPSVSYTGYISGIRITKGGALYSGTTYTVPTAPFTTTVSSGSVSLLTNFTNAAIFDNAAKNDMETVGNAQVSTSVTKFGNSVYFDGSGDYLKFPTSNLFNPYQGQYTVEMWIYTTSLSSGGSDSSRYGTLLNQETPGSSIQWGLGFNSSGQLVYTYWNGSATVQITSSATIAVNTWTHVGFVYINGSIGLFVNGIFKPITAVTTPSTSTTEPMFVGLEGRTGGGELYYQGYISNFRATKGLARYTYNFTPPTQAFGTIYAAPVTPAADPYFDYTTLLLPGSGTNGAQNNTFTDSSTNAFTITRNGNTTQGTFSPFSQTGWSNYFDGTSNGSLRADSTTDTDLSGDFTVQAWVFPTANGQSSNSEIISRGAASTFNGWHFGLFASTTQPFFGLNYAGTGATVFTQSSTNISLNQWTHVAVTRSGNTCKIYINGQLDTTNTGFTGTPTVSGTEYVYVGRASYDTSNRQFTGYVSNASIIKGTALTTFNTTTPLATGTSGQSLLTCTSNRFIDANTATTAKTLTVGTGASVQAFSPFAPTAAYSAATNGGSGYFDGTGDYLSVAGASQLRPGTGDFTLEGWFYLNNFTGDKYLINQNFNNADGSFGNFLIYVTGTTGVMKYWSSTNGSSWNNVAGIALGTAKLNEWFHVAVSRLSGTTKTFLNGVEQASQADSGNLNNTGGIYVGTYAPGQANVNGYASGVRLLVGTGYSSISIPTAPPTAITNTALLLNFTNAGITDATAKNDLETVGNAQISNTTAKWGSTSMYFDGTGDYTLLPDSQNLELEGDFTIEFWAYPTSASGNRCFISKRASVAVYSPYIIQTEGSSLKMYLSNSGSAWSVNATASTGVTQSTWQHIAMVKYGSAVTLYLNGNSVATGTSSGALMNNTTAVSVGATAADGTDTYQGYMQDVRITKGIARYTQNFTPPTAAFQLL